MFEDNLSSHMADAVGEFWVNDRLPFFQEFVPPNMTKCTNISERHVGIIYKNVMNQAMRQEMTRRLQEARQAAGSAN